MRRIFIKDILKKKIVITGGDAHHLGHVMRAKAGDRLVVADDVGKECGDRLSKSRVSFP